jgi:hypothetical protein
MVACWNYLHRETYKAVVKMTFAKGAALDDPSGLFNASLEGSMRRAIDFREGDKIDDKAPKTLVRATVTLNKSKAKKLDGGIARHSAPMRKRHDIAWTIFQGSKAGRRWDIALNAQNTAGAPRGSFAEYDKMR